MHSGAVRLDDLQGLHFLTVLHSRLIFAAPAPLHRSEEDSFKLELHLNIVHIVVPAINKND